MDFEISGDLCFIDEKVLIHAFWSKGFEQLERLEGDYFFLKNDNGRIRVSRNNNSYLFSYLITAIDDGNATDITTLLEDLFVELNLQYIIELYRVNEDDSYVLLTSKREWRLDSV